MKHFGFWRSQIFAQAIRYGFSHSSCVFVHLQMHSFTLPPVFLRSHCPFNNKASLSRNLHAVAPSLVHTLSQEDNSILSVATGDDHIYSGSQNQSISVRRSFLSLPHFFPRKVADSVHLQVWDNQTYTLQTQLRGHTGSVLALEYASDKHWLFSSSGVFVSFPGYPQMTELITGDSSVRVLYFTFPARFPLTPTRRCGIPRSLPRSTLSIPFSTLTRGTSSPSPGHPLFLPST